jgi:hypothetical protein
MECIYTTKTTVNFGDTKNNAGGFYSSLPNPKLLGAFEWYKQFSINGNKEQFHLFCEKLLSADESLQKIESDQFTIINNGASFLIYSTATPNNIVEVNQCLADFKADMKVSLLQHSEAIINQSVIVLNHLSDGLKTSKNIQELFTFLTEFCFFYEQYSQVWNSDFGKQIVVSALIDLEITNEEIDQYIVNCFKHKTLFVLEILLSLPGADLQLLVSQEEKTFRPSLFDKTKHGVYISSLIRTKRLSPLLHLAIQKWPEAVPILLSSGADIQLTDYYPAPVVKYYGNSPITNYYEFSSGGMTPLHAACILNQVTIIEALLNEGAEINCLDENGRTPLHMAALYNHPEAINLLVERHAKVECSSEALYVKKSGFDKPTENTPFMLSMVCGNSKAVSALLNKNCSLEYDKKSLLYLAITNRQIDVIRKLNENEPGFLDKNKAIVWEALARAGDVDAGLNDLKKTSGFDGLLDTYPHGCHDYLLAKGNDEFFPQLIELIKDQDCQAGVRTIELRHMLMARKYEVASNLLGLNGNNVDKNLYSNVDWAWIFSEEKKPSHSILHEFVYYLADNEADTLMLFEFLLKKAKEVGFDFSSKNEYGETISEMIEIHCKNLPDSLKEQVS